MDVGRLSACVPATDPEIQDQLGKIKSVAESSVHSVRNIALLLRPSMLDDLGLIAALEWQGREVSRRSEMEVEVESDGVSEDLAEEYKICIYRVTQEALNNAARHSGGAPRVGENRADARANRGHRSATMARGFDPQRTRGLGLWAWKSACGGWAARSRSTPSPGHGTTIVAELPLLDEDKPAFCWPTITS